MSKNLRALEQAYADARPKMKLHDDSFFNQVEGELDRAKSSAEKRRLHAKVHAHVKAILDKPANGNAKDEQDVVDGWFALLDVLQIEIQAAGDGDRAAGGAVVQGGWFTENDRGERTAVHVLNAAERVSDLPRNVAASADRPPLGDYLRGIVAGARTPEIRAALSEGVDSAGGYSIPTEVLGEFIDRLRAATCFVQAGAKTIMLDGAKTRIMRIASDPTATWRAENSAVSESEPTFDAIDFVPKSLACLVKVSRELLADSANAGDALIQALTAAMALRLDYAAFFGAGTGNEPRGLDNLAGVPTVTLGTGNGASMAWDSVLDAEYQIDVGNGGPVTAMVSHPRTWLTLRRMKSADYHYLGSPSGWALPGDAAGGGDPVIPAPKRLKTTAFPITQTIGTSTDCATAHVGNFAKAMLGMRQELQIMRPDQTFAGNL
jgi:HK97 family phage major capsid protein